MFKVPFNSFRLPPVMHNRKQFNPNEKQTYKDKTDKDKKFNNIKQTNEVKQKGSIDVDV